MSLHNSREFLSVSKKKMHYLNIFSYFSPQNIVKAVVCEKKAEDCLERNCPKCKYKKVEFQDFVKNEEIPYMSNHCI